MIIQAGNLPRILACNGSLNMERAVMPVSEPSQVTLEGIAAHSIIASVLRGASTSQEWLGQSAANGKIIVTREIVEMVDNVLSAWHPTGASWIEHECNSDYGGISVHGRADCIRFDSGKNTLYVDDFKFGHRLVSPVENWTLIHYASAFCDNEQIAPDRVIFTIFQPRSYHREGPVRSWPDGGLDLADFSLVSTELYRRLDNLSETLVTGWQCRDCPALGPCPAAREAGMNAIDVVNETIVSDDLSDDALGHALDELERAQDHAKALIDSLTGIAIHRIQSGGRVTGRSLEIGQGRKRWKSKTNPRLVAALTKRDDLVQSEFSMTPTQAIKAGISETIVAQFSERPSTGVKLVKYDLNAEAQRLLNGENKQ